MLNIGVPKETKGGRDKLGIWDSYIHTTIYKLEKQKTICYYKIYLISYNNLYWKITLKIVYIYTTGLLSYIPEILWINYFVDVQLPCPTLCDPMDCSMPGPPVLKRQMNYT